LIASFTSTSAVTRATTSITAAPATIHNHRGGFDPPDGGGAVPCDGGRPDGGRFCCQYGGNCLVGLVSFTFGPHGGVCPP
jgi:hypothetical protein